MFKNKLGVGIVLTALIIVVSLSGQVVAQEEGCGDSEINAGEYGKAIELCSNFLNSNPNNPVALFNLGRAYYWLDDDESAMENFNKSIDLDSTNSEVFYYRGFSNNYLQNYKKAIQDFFMAIELNPSYADSYAGLGDSYLYLKDYNTAIEYFTQAIDFDSMYGYAYWGRADAYYYLEADRFALQDYVNALIYYEDDYDSKYKIQDSINEIIELYVPAG